MRVLVSTIRLLAIILTAAIMIMGGAPPLRAATPSGTGRNPLSETVSTSTDVSSIDVSARPASRAARWTKLQIEWPPSYLMEELRRWPGLEIKRANRDEPIEAVALAGVAEEMRARGFRVAVVVEDLEEQYSADGADLLFGGFNTLSQIEDEISSLRSLYPQIVSEPETLAMTSEGRAVRAFKVSDNPDLEESEPGIVIDALHHAREPMSGEVLLHYAEYLCENYGIDPLVTFLVNEREIWFIPVVNPDGYYYNEETYPDGGGMWRKNRFPVLDCFGVDLNRNYPYMWAGDGGSSDPCDDYYRGPARGSELEVQGIMSFMIEQQPIVYHSFHSFGSQVLIPWGWTTFPTTDDALLREVGAEMARYNGYEVGQPGEILPYAASGISIDWAYGDLSEKPKIYSFMTEVGGGSFWPSAGAIPGICAENLYGNIYLTEVAGSYIRIDQAWLGGDGKADPGETVDMHVILRNHSLTEAAPNTHLVMRTQDSYIRMHVAMVRYLSLPPRASSSGVGGLLEFEVDPTCPPGHQAKLTLEPWVDGLAHPPDSLVLVLGDPPTVYTQDFETDSDWTSGPGHTATSGSFVRVEPNETAYQAGEDTSVDGTFCLVTGQNVSLGIDDVDGGVSVTCSPSIDLTDIPVATLKLNYFFGQRDADDDPEGDYFRIKLSNDGGASYPVTLVSLGDDSRSPNWWPLEVELHHTLPLTSQMTLRVETSDGPDTGDIIESGIDDVMIIEGSPNKVPSPPGLGSPADGDTVESTSPRLRIQASYDPDPGDTLLYGFEVYRDSLLTQFVAGVDGLPEPDGPISWYVDPSLTPGLTYWWRAYACDGIERSLAMPTASFTVRATTDVAREPAEEDIGEGPALWVVGREITYRLPVAEPVDLSVYDVHGRLVRTLVTGMRDAGEAKITWDGRNELGRVVGSGIYFLRLDTRSEGLNRKMAFVR